MNGEFTLPPTDPAAAAAIAANTAAIAALSAQLDASNQKADVRMASLTNLTLSGVQTIDGVVGVATNRVGVMGQTLPQNNGIYVMSAGAWSRAADADASAEVTAGLFFWVTEGTLLGDKAFELTTDDPIVLGTTPLAFQHFAGALKASQIVNDSAVTGATSAAAFNTLNTAVSANTTKIGAGALTAPGSTLASAADIADAINMAAALSPAFSHHIGITPNVGAASWNAQGFPAHQALDGSTITGRQSSNVSRATRRTRVGYVAAAAAINRVAGVNWFGPGVSGQVNRTEGFYASMYCQLVTPSPNGKLFMGLTSSANALVATSGAASNPSAILNFLGVGNDAPGALTPISNDGTGTGTVGAALTGTSSSAAAAEYHLELYAPPGAALVYYRVVRLDTPLVFTGSLTSDLPAANAQLFAVLGYHSNTDAIQVAVDTSNFLYIVPWT